MLRSLPRVSTTPRRGRRTGRCRCVLDGDATPHLEWTLSIDRFAFQWVPRRNGGQTRQAIEFGADLEPPVERYLETTDRTVWCLNSAPRLDPTAARVSDPLSCESFCFSRNCSRVSGSGGRPHHGHVLGSVKTHSVVPSTMNAATPTRAARSSKMPIRLWIPSMKSAAAKSTTVST